MSRGGATEGAVTRLSAQADRRSFGVPKLQRKNPLWKRGMDAAVSKLYACGGQMEFSRRENSKAIIRQDAGLWLPFLKTPEKRYTCYEEPKHGDDTSSRGKAGF